MYRAITIPSEPPPSQATLVFAIFLTAQVLDGLLTYWALGLFGLGIEANGLLVTVIGAVGADRGLLSAKLLACVCGYILFRTASHRPLAICSGLYVGVAVVPWMLVVAEQLIRR